MLEFSLKKLDFPVFSAVLAKDKIAVCGGGGGSHYGVPNKLATFNFDDLTPIHQLDTGDQLFEKLFFSESEKALIASTDKSVGVFSVMPSGIFVETQKLEFEPGTKNDSIVVEASGRHLFVVEKDSELRHFEKSSGGLEKKLNFDFKDTVLGMCFLAEDRRLIVVFSSKVVIFALGLKAVEQTIMQDYAPFDRFQLKSFGSSSQAVLLKNLQDRCQYFWINKGEEAEMEVQPPRKLFNDSATTLSIQGNFVFSGDTSGRVVLHSFESDGKMRKMASSQMHSLPSMGIVVKETKDSLKAWSFGADYFAHGFEVSRSAGQSSPVWRWAVVIIIMIFAVILGSVMKKK